MSRMGLTIAAVAVLGVGGLVFTQSDKMPWTKENTGLAKLKDEMAMANSQAGADGRPARPEGDDGDAGDLPKTGGPVVVVVGPDAKPLPHATAWLLWKDKKRCVRVTAGDDARIDVRDAAFVVAGDFPATKDANGFPRPARPEVVDGLAVPIDRSATRTFEATVADGTWMEVSFTGEGAADVDATTGVLVADEETHVGVAGRGEGSIVFTGLDAQRSYSLFARAPAKRLYAMETGLLAGRRERIELHEGKELSGRLVLPAGVAVFEADVFVDFAGFRLPATLEKDAGFRFAAMPPAALAVAVSLRDGPEQRFQCLPGSATVLLECKPPVAAPAPVKPAAKPAK